MTNSIDRLLEQDEFSVFLPNTCDVVEKSGVDIEKSRPIGGWCSTEDIDRQDEIVVAKGLDFSEFVNFGYFNDNHKQDTSAVLGYPRMVKFDVAKSRWWTEGNLLVGYPPADRVWELAKSLHKSDAPRKLGFSIEGKVLERDGENRILRAMVRNVAITNVPVNTACSWSILAKAFAPADSVQKAMTAAAHGGDVPGVELRRSLSKQLTAEDAVEKLQRLRPHLSKAAVWRIVGHIFSKEG